jgi:hypothetical protein
MSSIANFKSSFSGDVARPNRFDVSIPVPLTLNQYVRTAREVRYRCETTQLPGRTFSTVEQNTYGPTEKYPSLTTYNDIDLTFIVDDDMRAKMFFDGWMNFINPSYNNDFRYKENYATTLTINQYGVDNRLTYSVNLYDAYPISMNQLDLDWNAEGYHKLTVTFAYTYWRNNSRQALDAEIMDAAMDTAVGGLGGGADKGGNYLANRV